MASLLPPHDLNLALRPAAATATATATAATTTTTLLAPKLEPKQEPFDETFGAKLPLAVSVSSTPPPTCPHDSQIAVPTSSSKQDQTNLYSEYNRVTELFRTAFAKRFKDKYGGDIQVLQDPDSQAIVLVPEEEIPEETTKALSVVVSHRKEQRSSELVRVSNLGPLDKQYFRDIVRRTRMLYDSLRMFIVVQENRNRDAIRKRTRGDLKAAQSMRDNRLWLNRDKRIVGPIPGVEIGDIFFFRMELCVVGLHGQPQAGIDYVSSSHSSNGEPIATSIIVSGGYEDDQDAGDLIIYTGHGGQDKLNRQCTHQKLECGNLAMERSMHYGIEVRVIRGFKYENSISQKIYVYDGLYRILECWFDVGKSGFGVYKFKLLRIEGQPDMGSLIMKFAQTIRNDPLLARPVGYLSLDIANGKEKFPVLLYNDIDNDVEPLYYEYLPRTVFPHYAYGQGVNGSGCNCVSGCSEGCWCAMKNGGEFAYDFNGQSLRGKPVIFECGPLCQCPPTCRNRVTQHGLRYRLEVFRSKETNWGVRTLDVIHAGAFICEYAGVALTREQAQIFSMNGDSLMIYPDRFSERWAEWGDLSQVYPDYSRPSYPSIPPLDFAMDVSKMRNVACYISQSSSPNVFVQYVLYDHSNLMFPHIMLFAMENIPPLKELSLDYGSPSDSTGKLSICN